MEGTAEQLLSDYGRNAKYIFTDGLRQNVVYLKFWRELSWQAM